MNLLRTLEPNEHARVGFIELFFDLVFVFAVTQLSHTLMEDLTLRGAFQALILFMAVWWAWIDTAWVTNWLNPQRVPVRLMLFAVMLAGLVLSTSLPEAFGERGLAFACAYAAIQAGRSLFTAFAFRGKQVVGYRNFQRISAWHVLLGLLWIAGGLAGGEMQLALWTVAVLIELAGPLARFWTPWHGRSSVSDWRIEGSHMAERCGLFIIIALGESILVTGATFAASAWTGELVAAFVVAFAGSAALWWIYFDAGQELGKTLISQIAEPGRLARAGYTYTHIPIVAGIVLTAVGDELVMHHPGGHVEVGMIAAIVGGPALYLIGTFLFRRTIMARMALSQLAGIAALGLLAMIGSGLTPLALSGLTALVLVAVAVIDRLWLTPAGA